MSDFEGKRSLLLKHEGTRKRRRVIIRKCNNKRRRHEIQETWVVKGSKTTP